MSRAAPATRRVNAGSGHTYWVDGEQWKGRGVTTLISGGMPNGGLVTWAGRKVADCALDERDVWEPLADRSREAAWDYLSKAQYRDRDAAANRGTLVHALAERLARGEEVDVPEALTGHVDSYLEWREVWRPTDELIERMVVNRAQRYAGTFDAIATVPGWNDDGTAARVLYDIKTARTGAYPSTALQLSAYRYGETMVEPDGGDEQPVPEVDACAVLHIRADGFSFIPIDAGPRTFRQFLYVAQTAEFEGGWKAEDRGWGWGLIGDELSGPRGAAA
jgi:hypothetical protein